MSNRSIRNATAAPSATAVAMAASGGSPPDHEQRVGVGADHEELAVGEVDDLQDPEDEGEPEGHERVDDPIGGR